MRKSHEQGMFFGTLLVAEQGEIVYSGAFGYANRETKEPLSVDSVFYLASLSKQFTAMGVLLLEQQERLSLQDSLAKFFPEFPDYAKRVEIRHLLTHTSGIPDHFRLGAYEPGLTNEEVLALLARQPELDFEPGERFSYSNGGYVLLSLLVERVSGQSLGEFLQARIFEPLSMRHSLVFERAQQPVAHRVLGYDASGKLDDYEILTTGAGGVYSSAADLFRWDRALYTEALLPSAALERAFSPTRLNSGQWSQYGYGWKTHEDSISSIRSTAQDRIPSPWSIPSPRSQSVLIKPEKTSSSVPPS